MSKSDVKLAAAIIFAAEWGAAASSSIDPCQHRQTGRPLPALFNSHNERLSLLT